MPRRPDEGSSEAPEGADLYERVVSIVRDETDDWIAEGRVACIVEQSTAGDPGGEIALKPTDPSASALWLSVDHDVINFSAGQAGAHSEIWSTSHPDWAGTVRGLVRCVRDGRYSERVQKGGLFFPLKVTMRFGGVTDRTGRRPKPDFVVDFASTLWGSDGEQPAPPVGETGFSAW